MARILLIDDDERARMAVADMLESIGHEVRCAADGAAGVELFAREPFDLVITDMVMPRQDGMDTISALRSDAPSLKLIAMSGGGATLGPDDYLDLAAYQGAAVTLRKPFGLRQLEVAIAELQTEP